MRLHRTKEEWIQLRDRYYDALTTPQEELELAEYIFNDAEAQTSEWDADRAVLSYLRTGREKRKTAREWNSRRAFRIAAAISGVALAAYFFTYQRDTKNTSWESVDGEICYYSEDVASEKMEDNLMLALADFKTVEDDLSIIFTD